jgi:hypothetical protein
MTPGNAPLLRSIKTEAVHREATKTRGNLAKSEIKCPECSEGVLKPIYLSTTEFIMMCCQSEQPKNTDVSKNLSLTSQTNHVNFRFVNNKSPNYPKADRNHFKEVASVSCWNDRPLLVGLDSSTNARHDLLD